MQSTYVLLNHNSTLYTLISTDMNFEPIVHNSKAKNMCISFHMPNTRHVFVKHGCPWRQQRQNMAKISKSCILTPPHLRGMGCRGSVSNQLMNLQSKFGYCIIAKTLIIALCK